MRLRLSTLTNERGCGVKDWSIFNEYEEGECHCRCGVVFASHSQIDMERRKSITRKPCPGCGKDDDCWMCSSPPERWTLRN